MSTEKGNDKIPEKTWKNYPSLHRVDGLSPCCGEYLILMQSMEGGFVSTNCFKCNKKYSLSGYQFEALDLLVACPDCGDRMKKVPLDKNHKNYGFRCRSCHTSFGLSDLLPPWESRQALAKR